MTGLPSVPQMKHRAHRGHKDILQRLAAGLPAFDNYPIPEVSVASTMKGRRIMMDTLRRWECINAAGITERGRELLAAL